MKVKTVAKENYVLERDWAGTYCIRDRVSGAVVWGGIDGCEEHKNDGHAIWIYRHWDGRLREVEKGKWEIWEHFVNESFFEKQDKAISQIKQAVLGGYLELKNLENEEWQGFSFKIKAGIIGLYESKHGNVYWVANLKHADFEN